MGRRPRFILPLAKADLRTEAQQAEERIRSTKLSELVQSNPEAVLVIEREIDDWTPKPSPDDGEVQRPFTVVATRPDRRGLPRRAFAHPVFTTGRRKAAS